VLGIGSFGNSGLASVSASWLSLLFRKVCTYNFPSSSSEQTVHPTTSYGQTIPKGAYFHSKTITILHLYVIKKAYNDRPAWNFDTGFIN
jgi:hypothetical protein